MSLKELKIDDDLVKDGIWFDVIEGIKVLLRSNEYRPFRDFMERETRRYKHILDQGRDIPQNTQKEIIMRGIAKHILIGWQGITDDDGNEIECNEQNAMKFMKEFDLLYRECFNNMTRIANYTLKAREDSAKNSVAS